MWASADHWACGAGNLPGGGCGMSKGRGPESGAPSVEGEQWLEVQVSGDS